MSARRLVVPLRSTLIAATVSCCFAPLSAFSNPTGPAVVNGNAAIVPAGPVLNITNTPNTIINWQGFSNLPGETVRFIQQSASSAVLNRVTTAATPSIISGALQSNGRVFLVNPSGIFFGSGSQVDVAGLVASTLNLTNEDFLAGRLKFDQAPGSQAAIVNSGMIRTAEGGHVYLIGNIVQNDGPLISPKGDVVLAAGQSVELVDPGTPNLRVEIVAPNAANEIINFNQIQADAGRIGIYAGLIRNFGTVTANRAVVGERGEILLRSTTNVQLNPGGTIATTVPGGGLPDQGGGNPGTTNGRIAIEAGINFVNTGALVSHGDLSIRSGESAIFSNTSFPFRGQAQGNAVSVESGGSMAFNSVEMPVSRQLPVLAGDQVALKVTTPEQRIVQDQFGFIRAFDRLDIAAAGDVNLPAENRIRRLSVKVDSGGDFLMRASPANTAIPQYEILGVDMRSGGAFSFRWDGFAFVHGDVLTGPQTWEGGGLIIGGDIFDRSVTVAAKGPVSINADSFFVGGGRTFGDFALLTATGPITTRGAFVGVNGGTGAFAPALIIGQDTINMEAVQDIRLHTWGGFGSVARIQTLGAPISLSFPTLTSGGFFVNDVEGIVRQGQTGFFTGLRPARIGETLLLNYAP